MMTRLERYPTTALDEWVTNFYLRLKILHPKQIKIEDIASRFAIFIHKKPMPSSFEVVGRYRGITLDSRVSKEQQKEMFFHELCHLLRHAGMQSVMPTPFRELQEWDAKNFTQYAAIPSHMIKYIDINEENVIDHMAGLFQVSHELCEQRLAKIHRKYKSSNRYMLVSEAHLSKEFTLYNKYDEY